MAPTKLLPSMKRTCSLGFLCQVEHFNDKKKDFYFKDAGKARQKL